MKVISLATRRPMALDSEAPWVEVLGSDGKNLSIMRCGRCGSTTTCARGVELDVWAEDSKAFMAVHRTCLPR